MKSTKSHLLRTHFLHLNLHSTANIQPLLLWQRHFIYGCSNATKYKMQKTTFKTNKLPPTKKGYCDEDLPSNTHLEHFWLEQKGKAKEEHEVKSHSHSSTQAVIMARRKDSFLQNVPLIMRSQAHRNAALAHSNAGSLLNKLAPSTAFGPSPCGITVLCWNAAGRQRQLWSKELLYGNMIKNKSHGSDRICKHSWWQIISDQTRGELWAMLWTEFT